MGYVDSDAHVRESESVWDHLDPAERHYRPHKDADGVWAVDDGFTYKAFDAGLMPREYNDLYPPGSVDLAVPAARLDRMDVLGVDVQVLFSTLWLNADISSPEKEAALMRSWNRWMADRVADTGGRLLWTLEVPFRLPERAAEELEFGKAHGATGVHLGGLRHGMTVADAMYRPVYERAQDLDLVIAVHVGGDRRKYVRDPAITFTNNVAPVPGSLYALSCAGIPAQYPRMRWAFVEAGASWLPFTIQQASRADVFGTYRVARDWRAVAATMLTDCNFFVTCEIDDDLPYLMDLVGTTNIVCGTDFTHMDLGSDPYALNIVATRTDVEPAAARAVVDANARRLWNIDPSFTPAPPPEESTRIVEASRAWTN